MLGTRLITALVLLPLFLGAVLFLSSGLWALFLAPWVAVAAWEWAVLSGYGQIARLGYAGLVLLLSAFLAAPYSMAPVPTAWIHAAGVVFWLLVTPVWLARQARVSNAAILGATGVLVIVPCAVALIDLQGRSATLLLVSMGIVWVSDSAAYLVGRTMGRHKLAPAVSPGKTWEGVAGGLAAVALYFFIIQSLDLYSSISLSSLAALGLFLAVALLGIEGDLFESWIKRQAGVKDSGRLLPGHGGVLDRIDALTSSMPLVALTAALLG